MTIINKRTGEKSEVTEAEAKKIANNPQMARLYHIPLPKVEESKVSKPNRKPLTEKAKVEEEKVAAPESNTEAVADEILPTE